jgi:hypothetical protein
MDMSNQEESTLLSREEVKAKALVLARARYEAQREDAPEDKELDEALASARGRVRARTEAGTAEEDTTVEYVDIAAKSRANDKEDAD